MNKFQKTGIFILKILAGTLCGVILFPFVILGAVVSAIIDFATTIFTLAKIAIIEPINAVDDAFYGDTYNEQ